MLVQDTPTSASHIGRTTDTGLQAAYLALQPAFELQEKRKNVRLALADVPDVVNASLVTNETQRQCIRDVVAELNYGEMAIAIGLGSKQVLTLALTQCADVESAVLMACRAVDQFGIATIRTVAQIVRAAARRMFNDGSRDDYDQLVRQVWGTYTWWQRSYDLAWLARRAAYKSLRQLRLERKWTQVEVVERLRWLTSEDLPFDLLNQYKRWERGRHSPSHFYARLLCSLFGVNDIAFPRWVRRIANAA